MLEAHLIIGSVLSLIVLITVVIIIIFCIRNFSITKIDKNKIKFIESKQKKDTLRIKRDKYHKEQELKKLKRGKEVHVIGFPKTKQFIGVISNIEYIDIEPIVWVLFSDNNYKCYNSWHLELLGDE